MSIYWALQIETKKKHKHIYYVINQNKSKESCTFLLLFYVSVLKYTEKITSTTHQNM